MIVRQFLQWVRTAPAGERAEASRALARAYLYSDLSKDDRAAAEGAMLLLLDDVSPLVRRALAEVLAGRPALPRAVCAALAETGSAMTCLTLLENAQADIAPASFERIAERHGNYSLIPGVLLARGDLPPTTRHTLVAKVSAMLVDFVTARDWLIEDRARRVAREACEKAMVTVAASTPTSAMRPLIQHLRSTCQLTAGLLLRALLSGNVVLF